MYMRLKYIPYGDTSCWQFGFIVKREGDKAVVFGNDLIHYDLVLTGQLLDVAHVGSWVKFSDDCKNILMTTRYFETYVENGVLVAETIAGAPNIHVLHESLRSKYDKKAWSPFLGLANDTGGHFSNHSYRLLLYARFTYRPDETGTVFWEVQELVKLVRDAEMNSYIAEAPWALEMYNEELPLVCARHENDMAQRYTGVVSNQDRYCGVVFAKTLYGDYLVWGHSAGIMEIGKNQRVVMGEWYQYQITMKRSAAKRYKDTQRISTKARKMKLIPRRAEAILSQNTVEHYEQHTMIATHFNFNETIKNQTFYHDMNLGKVRFDRQDMQKLENATETTLRDLAEQEVRIRGYVEIIPNCLRFSDMCWRFVKIDKIRTSDGKLLYSAEE